MFTFHVRNNIYIPPHLNNEHLLIPILLLVRVINTIQDASVLDTDDNLFEAHTTGSFQKSMFLFVPVEILSSVVQYNSTCAFWKHAQLPPYPDSS